MKDVLWLRKVAVKVITYNTCGKRKFQRQKPKMGIKTTSSTFQETKMKKWKYDYSG